MQTNGIEQAAAKSFNRFLGEHYPDTNPDLKGEHFKQWLHAFTAGVLFGQATPPVKPQNRSWAEWIKLIREQRVVFERSHEPVLDDESQDLYKVVYDPATGGTSSVSYVDIPSGNEITNPSAKRYLSETENCIYIEQDDGRFYAKEIDKYREPWDIQDGVDLGIIKEI